jgi:hypothetical protein
MGRSGDQGKTLNMWNASALVVFVLLTIVVAAGCLRSGGSPIGVPSSQDVSPLGFTLSATPTRVRAGDELALRYTISNPTSVSIRRCPTSWSRYDLFGTKRAVGGGAGSPHGGEPVTLPPRSELSWNITVRVPDLGPGPLKVMGHFDSYCGPSIGKVFRGDNDAKVSVTNVTIEP